MEKDLLKLEEELRAITPNEMSEDVLSRMVAAMESWQEKSDEDESSRDFGKIVEFPNHKKKGAASWHPTWAAAAAVALLGALGAILLPDGTEKNVTAMGGLGPVPLLRQASLVPVGGERVVSSMNTGMTSDRQGVPYQVIQVITQREESASGNPSAEVNSTRPRVETFIVPVSY